MRLQSPRLLPFETIPEWQQRTGGWPGWNFKHEVPEDPNYIGTPPPSLIRVAEPVELRRTSEGYVSIPDKHMMSIYDKIKARIEAYTARKRQKPEDPPPVAKSLAQTIVESAKMKHVLKMLQSGVVPTDLLEPLVSQLTPEDELFERLFRRSLGVPVISYDNQLDIKPAVYLDTFEIDVQTLEMLCGNDRLRPYKTNYFPTDEEKAIQANYKHLIDEKIYERSISKTNCMLRVMNAISPWDVNQEAEDIAWQQVEKDQAVANIFRGLPTLPCSRWLYSRAVYEAMGQQIHNPALRTEMIEMLRIGYPTLGLPNTFSPLYALLRDVHMRNKPDYFSDRETSIPGRSFISNARAEFLGEIKEFLKEKEALVAERRRAELTLRRDDYDYIERHFAAFMYNTEGIPGYRDFRAQLQGWIEAYRYEYKSNCMPMYQYLILPPDEYVRVPLHYRPPIGFYKNGVPAARPKSPPPVTRPYVPPPERTCKRYQPNCEIPIRKPAELCFDNIPKQIRLKKKREERRKYARTQASSVSSLSSSRFVCSDHKHRGDAAKNCRPWCIAYEYYRKGISIRKHVAYDTIPAKPQLPQVWVTIDGKRICCVIDPDSEISVLPHFVTNARRKSTTVIRNAKGRKFRNYGRTSVLAGFLVSMTICRAYLINSTMGLLGRDYLQENNLSVHLDRKVLRGDQGNVVAGFRKVPFSTSLQGMVARKEDLVAELEKVKLSIPTATLAEKCEKFLNTLPPFDPVKVRKEVRWMNILDMASEMRGDEVRHCFPQLRMGIG